MKFEAYDLFIMLYYDLRSIDDVKLPYNIYKIPTVDYRKEEIDQITY
jgi:hypothetical protein